MAIIQCPECKKEVSDKAQFCPSCGYAIGATVVEQTSKKWKRLQLIGAFLLVVGVITLIGGYKSSGGLITALLLNVAGLILVVYARTQTWWHHG